MQVIQNCTGSSSSSSSSSSSTSSSDCPGSDDTNVTVITSYNADGNVSSITAVNAITGNQTTEYVYGTTLSDSDIASSRLKRKEIYPDSVDSDDVIAFNCNRQGEVKEIRDQNGTVHAFDFDKLARQTQDRATTLGTGVDGGVRRIASSYEVRGMREKISSWNAETVGSGSVAKIANNLIALTSLVTAMEGLLVGQRAGLELGRLAEVVMTASGASPQVLGVAHQYRTRRYREVETAQAALRLAVKDLELGVELAQEVGLAVPTARAALEQWREADAAGLGEAEIFALLDHLERTPTPSPASG